MITEAIKKLVEGQDLTYDEALECMNEIFGGEATEIQISAYLTALRMKGETVDEISASARGMRNYAVPLEHDGLEVLEIVGTGGDEANSFNISTTSGLVAAAVGIPIAKHGNRSVSSSCGAADVLEALGVNITIAPEKMSKVLKEANICFMFAQVYHKAMKYVAPVRKELGIRTIFNILGPLTNPANASMQLMGVYEEALVEPMARVLSKLGVKNGMVVYGQDRLDEISLSAPTTVCEIREGKLETYVIEPEQYGMKKCDKEELKGGNPEENAKITKAILNGEKGAKRNAVVLNAAACIYIAKKADTMKDAVKMAEEAIDSGKAMEVLKQFVMMTNVD
ncbi:MAG: anthranilate phosphoribosyltransferase [Bacteroidales bacterium]|nr:anthranilate phosphoribosyltransferase [Clostridium sp.]MCM1203262.1 anthranilate phosphoribosyltransferase [Bacteroidales bacterium]